MRVRQFAGNQHDCAQHEFRVRDNGIGMSPEFAKKIFELSNERTTVVTGNWLGTAITEMSMMAHDQRRPRRTGKQLSLSFACVAKKVQTGTCREEKIAELAGPAPGKHDDLNTPRQRGKSQATRVEREDARSGRLCQHAVHCLTLPRPYHRLAAAGHERHRGRALTCSLNDDNSLLSS